MSTLSKDLPEAEALSDDAIIIIGNPSTGKLFRTTVAELKEQLNTSGIWAGTGTPFTSYTKGDLIFANDTNKLARLSIGTEGKVLKSVGGVPVWGDVPAWGLAGNAGIDPSTQFIGTTDDKDLLFKRNGTTVMLFTVNGLTLAEGKIYTPSGKNILIGYGMSVATTATNNNIVISAGSAVVQGNSQGHIAIGRIVKVGHPTIGYGDCIAIGTLAESTGHAGIAIGRGAKAYANGIIIGYNVSASHDSCIMLSRAGESHGSQRFIVGGSEGTNTGVIRDIFFGAGDEFNWNTYPQYQKTIRIQPTTTAGENEDGWTHYLAGGIACGTGIPGDIIFQTSKATASGTTKQTLYNRWYIKGDSGILSNILSPHISSTFHIDSTTKGALLPRMTTSQKNAIATPAEGLEVYDTTLKKKCFFNGTTWETITSS